MFRRRTWNEIYDEKYEFNGTSKAKRLRAFMEVEDAATVAYVLRKLWDYRSSYMVMSEAPQDKLEERNFFEVIARLETADGRANTDALDRLHTYCMKKFANLWSGGA